MRSAFSGHFKHLRRPNHVVLSVVKIQTLPIREDLILFGVVARDRLKEALVGDKNVAEPVTEYVVNIVTLQEFTKAPRFPLRRADISRKDRCITLEN